MKRPRMIYGYQNKVTGVFHKYTRISDSTRLVYPKNIDIEDNVWVGHFSILDGIHGIHIGEGSQLAAWIGVYTHSSHVAIRLYGKEYPNIPAEDRIGYMRGPVHIGPFCFLGAGVIVLPGVTLGKGCLVKPGAVVRESAPDFSVIEGNPGKIVGDSRKYDVRYLMREEIQDSYIDQEYLQEYLSQREKPQKPA